MVRNPYDPHDIDLDQGDDIGKYSPIKAYTYDYKNKSFYVPKRGSIDFTTKGNKNYQSTLWEVILEYWEFSGSKLVKIPKQEIISKVTKRLGETWNREKLKTNLRHLAEKVETNAQIGGLILLRPEADYLIFNINLPTD